VLELDIEGLDERGLAIGRHGGEVVRLRGALPGSRVRATVSRRRAGRIDAVLEGTLRPSAERVEPRCPHFGTCGGCSHQDLAYGAQLAERHARLARLLAPLGGPVPAPVVPCAEPWHYRNKMEFTFGARRWIERDEPNGADAGFALGLHVRGRHDKVLDVRDCPIAFAEAPAIVASARSLARELGLEAWDVATQVGLLRHLVLRNGQATGEILALLVTSAAAPERVEPFARALLARHGEITTLVQQVNAGVAQVAAGGEERVLHGSGSIRERVAGLEFAISANTFFQTNTAQAERLVELVRARAGLAPGELVFDLCCGCGLFALALAASGARVVGFELSEATLEDARANATANGLEGLRFVAGDLARTLDPGELARADIGIPRVCVVDPPRAGLHPRALALLARLGPERIVYVSCNPRSALRDLAALRRRGYRQESAEPVDLFPHTPHVECVFALARSAARDAGAPEDVAGDGASG
jgi:23S rRNA (uracil1939-C5)-methyltransferase